VNVVAWLVERSAEIEKKLTDAYVYVFKESTLTITNVTSRFVTLGVAGRACSVDDDRREDSEWTSRPTTRHPDALAAKVGGQWLMCGLPEY